MAQKSCRLSDISFNVTYLVTLSAFAMHSFNKVLAVHKPTEKFRTKSMGKDPPFL